MSGGIGERLLGNRQIRVEFRARLRGPMSLAVRPPAPIGASPRRKTEPRLTIQGAVYQKKRGEQATVKFQVLIRGLAVMMVTDM